MNEQKQTSVVPEAVRQLLEQRSTYREWLSRLDEVGGKYRSEVAERVRLDYEARREGVGAELAEHRHELVSSLERRRARLDELSDAFDRHSAELEEAELRFQVGEFDDAKWEETRETLAESIEQIEGELGDARSAVDELERVLGELGSGNGAEASRESSRASTPAPEAAGAAEAAEGADPPEAEAAEPPRARPSPQAAVPVDAVEATNGDDDAERADAKVAAQGRDSPDSAREGAEVRADAEVAASVGSATDRTADGPDGPEDYLDELEFLESLSLDDPDSFDAVSRMLDDEEDR
jgi:hypothetical protein